MRAEFGKGFATCTDWMGSTFPPLGAALGTLVRAIGMLTESVYTLLRLLLTWSEFPHFNFLRVQIPHD